MATTFRTDNLGNIVKEVDGVVQYTKPLNLTFTLGDSTSTTPPPSGVNPTITQFDVSAPSVAPGNSITLTWVTTDSSYVEITDSTGTALFTGGVTGTLTRAPSVDTTYTLRAVGPGGERSQSVSVTIVAQTGGTDSFAANVISLLRFNTVGATFTDDISGNTWTAAGGLVNSATGSIEGGSSLDLSGNTGTKYLASTTSAFLTALTFSTADFSIEVTSKTASTQSSFFTTLICTDTWALRFRNGAAEMEWDGYSFASSALHDGVAHRLAVVRASGVIYFFVDGALIGSGPWATNLGAPTYIRVGNNAAGDQPYNGIFDEIRITKAARATSAYTALAPNVGFPSLAGGGSPVSGDIIDTNGAIIPANYDAVFQAYAGTSAGEGVGYRFGAAASATGVPTLSLRADGGSINYGGASIAWQMGPGENVGAWFNDYVTNNGAAISAYKSGASFSQLQGVLDVYQIDRHTISQKPQLPWQNPVFQNEQIDAYIAMGTTLGLDPSDPADRPIIGHRHPGGADHDNCRMGLVATQGSATRGARVYCLGTVTARIPGLVILPVGYIPTSMSITNGAELLAITAVHRTNRTGHVLWVALGGTPAGTTWQSNPNLYYDWWHDFTDMAHPLFKNRGGWSFLKYIGKTDLPANCSAPTHSHMMNGIEPTEVIYLNGSISGMGAVASPLANNRTRFLPGGDLYQYLTKGACLTVLSQSEKSIVFIDVAPLFEWANDMYVGSAAKNLETQYYYLNGAGAPAAALGNVGQNYLNTANGDVYQKSSTGWAIIGSIGTKRGLGMGQNNWPYLLSDYPTAAPVVVKTLTSSSRLRGVLGTYSYGYDSRNDTRRQPGTPGYPMNDPHYPQIWVLADGNDGLGEIQTYRADTYIPGSTPAPTNRAPSDIYRQSVAAVGVSEQVTCVAPAKDYDVGVEGVTYDPADSPPGPLDKCVAFNDRKNRFIAVYQFQGNTGLTANLIGKIADSRMDCTSFAFVDPYYLSNKVITCTNYTAQCVDNYRIASPNELYYPPPDKGTPVVYSTLSGSPGSSPGQLSTGGEYGGRYPASGTLQGYPIMIHCSNAP